MGRGTGNVGVRQRAPLALVSLMALGLSWPVAARAQVPGRTGDGSPVSPSPVSSSPASPAARPDSGAAAPALALREQACATPPFDAAALAQRLRVELTVLGVHALQVVPADWSLAADAGPLALIEVAPATCAVEADEVLLSVVDRPTAKQLQRRVGLQDVPRDARPRALAIAIVELLQVSWAELLLAGDDTRTQGVPAPALGAVAERLSQTLERRAASGRGDGYARARVIAEQVVAEAAARRVETERRRARELAARREVRDGLGLALGLGVQGSPGDLQGVVGPRFAVSWPVGSRKGAPARFEVGVGYAGGVSYQHDVEGEASSALRTDLWSADVGLRFVSASRPRLELGPRLQVAYATPTVDELGAPVASLAGGGGVVFNAGLSAAIVARAGEHLRLRFVVDLAYALAGVVFLVDDERAGGLTGVNVGLRAGVAWVP